MVVRLSDLPTGPTESSGAERPGGAMSDRSADNNVFERVGAIDLAWSIACPHRCTILLQLARCSSTVCALATLVDQDVAVVSRRLADLRGVGLVSYRRSGRQRWYRLTRNCSIGSDGARTLLRLRHDSGCRFEIVLPHVGRGRGANSGRDAELNSRFIEPRSRVPRPSSLQDGRSSTR